MEMELYDFSAHFERLDKLFEESEMQLKLLSENINNMREEIVKDLETWMI